VKLPATVQIGEQAAPITILEAVIKQTGCYAKSRMGRLSVFWGDQVFIPTVPVAYAVTHHADILCSLGPMLSEGEWKAKGMDKYGLIAQAAGGAAQVEKVDHATAVQLLASLGEIKSVGASLGSFSVSSHLLFLLLGEFSAELEAKKGKLDSDPHLWMPMTLERAAYLQLMGQKGITGDVAGAHFDRIQTMMTRFGADEGVKAANMGVFGPVDVGQGVFWWDYGQLPLYQKNTIMMTDMSDESDLMRLFFGIEGGSRVASSDIGSKVTVDNASCISASTVGSGTISRSVLSNVRCNSIDADGCVLINVTADRIVAKPGSVLYNVVDSGSLSLEEGAVLAGVFAESGSQLVVTSSISTDGGKVWETKLAANSFSFEGIYNSNTEVCPTALEGVIAAAHATKWASIETETEESSSKRSRA
jgi:cytoskeletal protein CcmA (bactofilin family)